MHADRMGAILREKPPKVSVAIATYNGARFLPDAVRSVLDQGFRDFELLIADDGSVDDTAALADALARDDDRVRVLKTQHGGIARATNHALAAARGAYFAPMDQDDMSLPQRLGRSVSHLDDHPDVVALSGDTVLMDEAGRALASGAVRSSPQHAAAALSFECALVHPASMMRTEVLRSIGGYRTEFSYAHDYDVFLRMAERGGMANLPIPLLRKRVHPAQATRRRADRGLQVVSGAVAYMSRLARVEYEKDILPTGEPLERVGARFISTYLEQHRVLRADVVHHFSRFLRFAPMEHRGSRETANAYIRYLAAAARAGGARELLRSGYYVVSFHLGRRRRSRRGDLNVSRPA